MMIQINLFFLYQRSYHFQRNWSYISFLFLFKSSNVFPHPFENMEAISFFFFFYRIERNEPRNGVGTGYLRCGFILFS
ncbi:hypothetical protein AMTRI_Chr04g244860 [Amborella trichopoda]